MCGLRYSHAVKAISEVTTLSKIDLISLDMVSQRFHQQQVLLFQSFLENAGGKTAVLRVLSGYLSVSFRT
jgi:hypothetical protein